MHTFNFTSTISRLWRAAIPVGLALMLNGCSTAPPGEGVLDKALGLVGLQQRVEPPAPALTPDLLQASAPTRIPLRIHASEHLNSDSAGRPLSLVLKIYKLKSYEEFLRLSYQDFVQGKASLPDAIAKREVVLLPGQRYEVEESLSRDAAYVAVVALFRSPAQSRWRFVFDVKQSGKQGLTLGAHQCALSVSQGLPVGAPAESARLAGTVCQ